MGLRPSELSRPGWRADWLPLILVALTVLAFLPLLNNEFVNWGDQADLVDNPHYRGLGWSNLVWMFTTIQTGHYQPLAWISFAGDFLVWGMQPRGYHLTSLILHALNAVVVYYLILELLRLAAGWRREGSLAERLSAFAGALLFSLHPLRVETVAWATERRGVLSGLFYLLALVAYLRYAETQRPGPGSTRRGSGSRFLLGWSFASFALALLAKEFAVTLPAVLIVLDVYPLRRLRGSPTRWLDPQFRPVWKEKIPFFALSLVGAYVAMLSSAQSGVARALDEHGLVDRVAQSFYGLGFFLSKTLVPTGLSPLHPIPDAMNPLAARYVASAVLVSGLTVALILLSRRFPAGLAAWVCCVIVLSPVLGWFQTGRQITAERYSYLPAVAISVLVAAGLRRLLESPQANRIKLVRAIVCALAVIGLLALGVTTWRQARVWRTSASLWAQALSVYPDSPTANNNMGWAMLDADRVPEAIGYLETALAREPEHADALNNLGVALARQGKLVEAIGRWNSALEADPRHAGARRNLARARRMTGSPANDGSAPDEN